MIHRNKIYGHRIEADYTCIIPDRPIRGLVGATLAVALAGALGRAELSRGGI